MGRAYGPGVVADLRGAVIGAVVWVLAALATATGAVDLTLIDVLLLLAPLVVVPVGLLVAGRSCQQAAVLLRLAAAALVVPSLVADDRAIAGALALPWLVVAVHLFVTAALSWLDATDFGPAALARLASPAYLTVGATGLVASRLGVEPFGIGEPIVELTAVHFHYAGFAAALLAARTHEVAGSVTPRWAGAGTLLTIASPPIVAVGFTTRAPLPQITGAMLLTLGVWMVAGLAATVVARRTAVAGARALLIISALSVAAPMVLAVFWAGGQHYDVPALDVPAMARVHGTLNAFGFSLGGLLAWLLRDLATTPGASGPPTPRSKPDPAPAGATRRRPSPRGWRRETGTGPTTPGS